MPDPCPTIPRPAIRSCFRKSIHYVTGRLAVDSPHTLYWEACGRAAGRAGRVPARRAGRAAACRTIAAIFDPAFWRIVLVRPARRRPLDADRRDRRQHDAGTSSPISSACARICGIDRWLAVRRLVGIDARARLRRSASRALPRPRAARHLSRAAPAEIDWFMHGMRNVFPEAWRAFAEFLPAERARRPARQLLPAPHRSRSRRASARRARVGSLREARARRCCRRPIRLPQFDSDAAALAIARIEAHYFVHSAFLADGAAARRHRAGFATCPARSSRAATTSSARRSPPTRWRARGPKPSYVVVPDAGHSVREPGITRELVAAVRADEESSSALREVSPPSVRRRLGFVVERGMRRSQESSVHGRRRRAGRRTCIPNSRRGRRPVNGASQFHATVAGLVDHTARRWTSSRSGRVTPCNVMAAPPRRRSWRSRYSEVAWSGIA